MGVSPTFITLFLGNNYTHNFTIVKWCNQFIFYKEPLRLSQTAAFFGVDDTRRSL